MFDSYFKKFHDRLVLQHGRIDIDSVLQDSSELMRLSEYTQNAVSCEA
jgi:hypothetical protein